MRYPAALAAIAFLFACSPGDTSTTGDTGAAATAAAGTDTMTAATPGAPASDDAKIAEAQSAAPDSIGRYATVNDWPASEGAQMRQLRAGTNGWVCYPSTPAASGAVGQDPMCLDPVFQQWLNAYVGKTNPNITQVGFAYMLKGDRGASNTDPAATDSTATNSWVRAGPHLMMVAPRAQLASIPAQPGKGPWVMWKETPYAHVMMPAH